MTPLGKDFCDSQTRPTPRLGNRLDKFLLLPESKGRFEYALFKDYLCPTVALQETLHISLLDNFAIFKKSVSKWLIELFVRLRR